MRYQKFIPHFGPVVGSNKVYVAGSDKKLRVFNYKDGKLIEEKKFSNSFSTPPILINSTLKHPSKVAEEILKICKVGFNNNGERLKYPNF